MSAPHVPRVETRRRRHLNEELVARGRTWIPEWRPRNVDTDMAGALFAIAARIGAEVTQRLDRIPEKAFRGFLHWLGVRGEAGRAARLPVAFAMTPGSDAIDAPAGVQLQATDVQPNPVFFETEKDLRLIPANVASVVAVDPGRDAFFQPADALSPLEPPKPSPGRWTVKASAAVGERQLQLEPELGLADLKALRHEQTGRQYEVEKVEGGIVHIKTVLKEAAQPGHDVTAILKFRPFDVGADGEYASRNRQEHSVYIGSESLLNIEGRAEIQVRTTGAAFDVNTEWKYWGKTEDGGESGWQDLKAEKAPDGLSVILKKAPGSIDIRKIDNDRISSRFIRAAMAPPTKDEQPRRDPLPIGRVSLAINCPLPGQEPPCPVPAGERSTVPLEAIANSTPVVRGVTFYPFGPDPRQFDAFYLGSPEAFSKPSADVGICIEMEDGTSAAAAAALVGDSGKWMLFSVGTDGNLHRVSPDRAPDGAPVTRLRTVRPPFGDNGTAAGAFAPAPLNRHQPARLGTVTRRRDPNDATKPNDAVVAATAGHDVWLWRQTTDAVTSRWHHAGRLVDPTKAEPALDEREPPAVLVARDGDGLRLVGVNGGHLFTTALAAGWETASAAPRWETVPPPPDDGNRVWSHAAPVFRVGHTLEGPLADDGWLVLADDGGLALRRADGTWTAIAVVDAAVDASPLPLGLRLADGRILVVARQGAELVAWTVSPAETVVEKERLAATAVGSFDWSAASGSKPAIVFVGETGPGERQLATWFPLGDPNGITDPQTTYVGERLDGSAGAPTVAQGVVITPGARASLRFTAFQADGLRLFTLPRTALEDVVVFAAEDPPYAVGDFIEITDDADDTVITRLTSAPTALGADRFMHRPAVPRPDLESAGLYRPVPADPLHGTALGDHQMELDASDHNAAAGRFVLVRTAALTTTHHRIESVVPASAPRKITAVPPLPGASGAALEYWYVAATADPALSEVLPLLQLSGLSGDTVTALRTSGAYFTADPAHQRVLHYEPGGANAFAILGKPWVAAPGPGDIALLINGIYGAVLEVAAPSPAVSARLSWEYWDGSSWWAIDGVVDGTAHLRNTGVVSFCVPEKLQETEVAGRKNHWIRARLVEGDYGKERVSVKTSLPDTSGVTTQTVERSRADIAAPQVVWVDVRYSICCFVEPDHVVTEDGGTVLDKSVANKTKGATIEAFLPLAQALGRLDGVDGDSLAEALVPSRRALYLGFDTPPQGGPISVLFLVEEGDHDDAYPLVVDVLRENGFESVTAEDDTRGLNESGVLSFSLPTPPAAVQLFGQPRFWLRLQPRVGFNATAWDPVIRAIHPNATFARAAETQVNEPLGSSNGGPHQRVFLARPPVLEGTLRLCVREPLGEEDQDELRRLGQLLDPPPPGRVGPWILWKEVEDPLDGGPGDRVFSLDDETGEIRFGDGLHGMIPPIGADVILAARYQRGGGDAANSVRPWSQVSLVTPLQGVERVVVPEPSAGGSSPQDAAQIVRFAPDNQRMRDRALTLRDLEAAALQFSPAVGQVRALPAEGGVRLVVVMRRAVSKPTAAERRELRRYLLERALPMLGTEGALAIEGPRALDVRVGLHLTLESLDHAGTVTREADTRLQALLDPATGGLDRTGWPLGVALEETEIAARLDGIAHVESLDRADVFVVGPDGRESPMPAALRPDDLVRFEGLQVHIEVPAEHVA